ncbi:MAG: hypothetical protein ACKO9H_20850 [Planctomycetota bacterium]
MSPNRSSPNRPLTSAAFALVLCLLASAVNQLSAQQLRIESNVYREGRKEPIATTLTLIDNGFVYDFSLDPMQPDSELAVAIYDYNRKTINLLDCQRQVRLTLEQFEILKMVEEQRAQLSQNSDLEFLVAPQFTEQTDIASGTVSLEHPQVSYKATCEKAKDLTALPIYYDAVDQLTRLASSDPERLPPFPRLVLNQTIRKYNLMPTQIEMKLASEGLLQRDLQMRSEHTTIWQLSTLDQQRIDQAKRKYMSFPVVTLGKFRGLKKEKTEVKNPTATDSAKKPQDN